MSGIRRFIPYLAAICVLLAMSLTAALASTASAAPPSEGMAAAVSPALSHPAQTSASSARFAAEEAASLASVKNALAAAAVAAKAAAAASAAYARNPVAYETAALRAAGVPCDVRAVACVSLSKQEAWLMHDGKVVYGPVAVGTGRTSLPTPTGDFHVWYKVVNGWSSTYDAPMPYSVFFYKGDAFHEDPVTVRSHGCVHLSLTNAEYFYHFLHYGDLVEVRR